MMYCEELNEDVGFCSGRCKACEFKSNVYECINTFYVDAVDGDGFLEEQDGLCVEKGTKWLVDNISHKLFDGEVRLTSLRDNSWIELSNDEFENSFVNVN